MSDPSRTIEEARDAFKSCKTPQFYDQWALTCEKDHSLMDYRAHKLAVDLLLKHFSGAEDQAKVLDLACGSGLVAKLMFTHGFRQFVGIDCSEGILEEARKTGLYQDVLKATLGTDALSVEPGAFDVVTLVGALYPGFVPVGVIRELCAAVKPGGLVCLARGNYLRPAHLSYAVDLHKELKALEEEGLWTEVQRQLTDKYLQDPHGKGEYITGTAYLYRRS